MKMKLQLIIIGILLSTQLFADGYYPEPMPHQHWSVTASVGNGKYQGMRSTSSKTAIGRLALGNELMLTGELAWGLELGIQNGNRMRLAIPEQTLILLGWLPINTNLGPMVDLLVTAKSDPIAGSSFFAQVKGGVAYRKWKIEHPAINNMAMLAGEIQAGLGYPLTALASLNLLYQGIFGNEPGLVINPSTQTGHVANIPVLHAVLLGFSVNI